MNTITHSDPQQLSRDRQFEVLNEAAMAIAGELHLDKVLQLIVDAARELAGAQFAALGVPNAEGFLDAFIYSGMTAQEARRIPHFPQGLGLLGAIIKERKIIRLPKIGVDPRSVGFPENHPPMDSFLGVPVMAGEQMLGNLYLTNKEGAPEFSQEDEDMVQLLAAHAAIAIQNARLYEQVARLAVIEERTRIGMDLHDGIIQSIFAVGLTLESTRLALPKASEDAEQLLGQAVEGLNDAIRDIRNFILDLRPQRFSGDLGNGLGRLVREFQANTMIPAGLHVPAADVASLPIPVARAIFLTTQEALANIARHARASKVTIEVAPHVNNQLITLTIMDDGRGFDTSQQNNMVGHGLSNMRARAESLNGSFGIYSVLGRGTKITMTLPQV
ncbi:MAG: GAF domain-containing sensor histidine kinase [Chloroflexi bacterium]|nr:GAF domain-containing sensor histidine kinase [Chloroflexota bacterium]